MVAIQKYTHKIKHFTISHIFVFTRSELKQLVISLQALKKQIFLFDEISFFLGTASLISATIGQNIRRSMM